MSTPSTDSGEAKVHARFGAGVAMMSAGIWIEYGVNFITFVILARLIGASELGLAMMVVALVLVCETLVRETIADFLIQKADLEPGHASAAFWILLAASATLVALIWICAPLVASLYGEPRATDLLRASSVTVFLVAATATPVAILRRNLRFQALAWRTVAGPVAGLVAAVLVATQGGGAWSIVAQRIAASAVTDGLVWFAAPHRPTFAISRKQVDEVWRYGARMLGLRASEAISMNAPLFAGGIAAGPTAMGYYAAAWRLIDALSFILATPLRFVAMPAFAALQKQGAGASTLLRATGQTSSLYVFACFAGVAVVAPSLLETMFGETWRAAAGALRILAVVGVYLTIERVHQAYCLAIGRAGAMLGFSTLELAATVVLVAMAAPFGAEATAGALAVRSLALWPLRLRYTLSLAGISMREYVAAFAAPALSALAMAAIVVLSRPASMSHWPAGWELVASVALGVLVYCGLAVLFLRKHLATSLSLFQSIWSRAASRNDMAAAERIAQ